MIPYGNVPVLLSRVADIIATCQIIKGFPAVFLIIGKRGMLIVGYAGKNDLVLLGLFYEQIIGMIEEIKAVL